MMYPLGTSWVDPVRRRVSRGATSVRLSPKAMQVLEILKDARGGVLSRAELLDQVWPDVAVGDEVVTHAIAELRKAFGESARDAHCIETVHKSGYRLRLDQPQGGHGEHPDLDHYAACLDASELFYRGGEANVRLAADRFAVILETDPGHVLARAGLTKSLVFIHEYFGSDEDLSAPIEHCGRDAVAADPGAAEAHAALGLALTALERHDEAMASFAHAIKLNPGLGETHYLLGRACFAKANYRLAATMLERAAVLRSDDFHALIVAAKARRFLGDERACRAALIKAMPRIDERLSAYPDDRIALCDKVCCLVELGSANAGVELAASLVHQPPPSNYYLIGGLVRAGEIDLAMACFETVIESGWRHGTWVARDHDLDPLRRQAGFGRIAKELRAAA